MDNTRWKVLASTIVAVSLGLASQADAAPTNNNPTRVAQATSRIVQSLQRDMMGLSRLLKSPKWDNYSWNYRVKSYIKKATNRLVQVRQQDPKFDANRADKILQRMIKYYKTKGGKAVSSGKLTEMRATYKAAYDIVSSWPYTLHATSLKQTCLENTYIDNIHSLDWQGVKKRLAADRTKFARLFVYTSSGTPPAGIPYKPASKSGLHNEDEKVINRYIIKILQWRDKLAKSSRPLAMNIQSAIVEAEKAYKGKKVDCSIMAVKMADAVLSLQPNNMQAQDLRKDAIRLRKKMLRKMGKYITGPFHRNHLREIVLFTTKPRIGKESAAATSRVIVPGKPAYLTGYFTATMKDTGGAPSLVMQVYKDGKLVKTKHTQGMYRLQATKNKVNNYAHVAFNLFPDPATTRYKSHYEYLPSLHITKWLLYQAPGKYRIKFTWGRTNPLASGTFTVDLSRANREALRGYYDKLMAAKVKSVTFSSKYGCSDARRQITNVSHLKKYGKLLKVSLSKTGNIMKKWPRQREIDFNTARGWGAFVNSDNKIELIPLEFRKRPNARRWNWHSLAFKPNNVLGLSGPTSVSPALLDFGWEATKKGIKKCTAWM